MANLESTLFALDLVEGQAGNESKHNELVELLLVFSRASAVDKDLTAPPGSPSDSAAYVVSSVATGSWASHEDSIAIWTRNGAWVFIEPTEGQILWMNDENLFYHWNGSAWTSGPA